MKFLIRLSFLIAFAIISQHTVAQVGVGTITPDSTAILDVTSTTKGLLIPRMTLSQRNVIVSPTTGLLIYQSNSSPGFYYYTGTQWECLATCGSASSPGIGTWVWDGPTGGDTMTTGDTMVVEADGHTSIYFKVDGDFSGVLDGTRQTVVFGHGAGLSKASTFSNTFIGDSAGFRNERGSVNTFIGKNAGRINKYGFKNVAIGYATGPDLDSTYNTIAVGADIKINDHNTAVIGNAEIKRWGFGTIPEQGKAFQVGSDTSNGNGAYLSNGGDWSNGSSRTFKHDIHPVKPADILERVSKLSIYSWKYKGSTDKHIGPIAEDFYELFGTGQDRQHISTIDPAGVSLAAIQQLYKRQLQLEKQLKECQALIKKQGDELKSLKR